MPKIPMAVCIGPKDLSIVRNSIPEETAYFCHPIRPSTISFFENMGLRDSITFATAPPTIGAPIWTGSAYDFASFIRPLIYGSRDNHIVCNNISPSLIEGICETSISKSSSVGQPIGLFFNKTLIFCSFIIFTSLN